MNKNITKEEAIEKLEQIAIGCKFLKDTAQMHLDKDYECLKNKTPDEQMQYVKENIDFILNIVER